MHLQNELIFFRRPFSPDNGWIDDVMPPFSALPSKSSRQVSGNDEPILSAIVADLLLKDPVLFLGPLIARADLLCLC